MLTKQTHTKLLLLSFSSISTSSSPFCFCIAVSSIYQNNNTITVIASSYSKLYVSSESNERYSLGALAKFGHFRISNLVHSLYIHTSCTAIVTFDTPYDQSLWINPFCYHSFSHWRWSKHISLSLHFWFL